jgi:3-keto-L-gulonate-6-phosphate decarboxylase
VLNLPLRYAEEDAYMFEQVCHHHPIVDGRTAREMSETLLYRLSWTDLPQQQKQLAQAHVKYLLLHRQRDGLYRWNKQLAPVSAYTKNYHIVYDGWDMTVLRVY